MGLAEVNESCSTNETDRLAGGLTGEAVEPTEEPKKKNRKRRAKKKSQKLVSNLAAISTGSVAQNQKQAFSHQTSNRRTSFR